MGKGNGSECRGALVIDKPTGHTLDLTPEDLFRLDSTPSWQGLSVAQLYKVFKDGPPNLADQLIEAGILEEQRTIEISEGNTQTRIIYKLTSSAEELIIKLRAQALSLEAKEVMMGFLAKHSQFNPSWGLEMTKGELKEVTALSDSKISSALEELKNQRLLQSYYIRKNLLTSPAFEMVKAANQSLKLPWQEELTIPKLNPKAQIKPLELLAYKPDTPPISNLDPGLLHLLATKESITYSPQNDPQKQEALDRMIAEGYLKASKRYTTSVVNGTLTQAYTSYANTYTLTKKGVKAVVELKVKALSDQAQKFISQASDSLMSSPTFNQTMVSKLMVTNRKQTRALILELIQTGFIQSDRSASPRYSTATLGRRYLETLQDKPEI